MSNKVMLLASMAVGMLVLAGCQPSDESAPATAVRPVISMVVAPASGMTTRFAGIIVSRVQADLGFRFAGRLISRPVNVGDHVTTGQVVAEVDATSLELALRAAKADFESAQAQFDNAQGNEQRQSVLFGSGNTTQTNVELVTLRFQLAEATLYRAQSTLRKAEDQLGYAQLHAGFDGVVTMVNLDPGSDLLPGQPILTIAKPDLRDAVIDVPAAFAASLRVGAQFVVSLQLDPNISATGTLREIAPDADTATRTRRIKIGLDGQAPAFRIGTTVSVLSKTANAGAIEVPLSAIQQVAQQTYVWLINPATGRVSRQEITVEAQLGEQAVVVNGLSAGMRIAVAGVNSLTDGQQIAVTGQGK